MSIEILNFKSINKGHILGTCDIRLPKWGNFMIYKLTIFEKNENRWVSFPSEKFIKDGQKYYIALCRFESPNLMEIFRKNFFIAFDKLIESMSNPEKKLMFNDPQSVFSTDEINKTKSTPLSDKNFQENSEKIDKLDEVLKKIGEPNF